MLWTVPVCVFSVIAAFFAITMWQRSVLRFWEKKKTQIPADEADSWTFLDPRAIEFDAVAAQGHNWYWVDIAVWWMLGEVTTFFALATSCPAFVTVLMICDGFNINMFNLEIRPFMPGVVCYGTNFIRMLPKRIQYIRNPQ